MTKVQSLEKYLQEMNNKLSSPIPERHKHNPRTYVDFLSHEIKMTKAKIDNLKVEGKK